MKEESFLSHVILKEGMSVDSCKNRGMLSGNAPVSAIDICSLLRVVGYYRKFIEGILKITKLLEEDKNSSGRPPVKLDFRS
jgi:hypothetical protein